MSPNPINKLAAELSVASFHLRSSNPIWLPYLDAMLDFKDCTDVSGQRWCQGNRAAIVRTFLDFYPVELRKKSVVAVCQLAKHLKVVQK